MFSDPICFEFLNFQFLRFRFRSTDRISVFHLRFILLYNVKLKRIANMLFFSFMPNVITLFIISNYMTCPQDPPLPSNIISSGNHNDNVDKKYCCPRSFWCVLIYLVISTCVFLPLLLVARNNYNNCANIYNSKYENYYIHLTLGTLIDIHSGLYVFNYTKTIGSSRRNVSTNCTLSYADNQEYLQHLQIGNIRHFYTAIYDYRFCSVEKDVHDPDQMCSHESDMEAVWFSLLVLSPAIVLFLYLFAQSEGLCQQRS